MSSFSDHIRNLVQKQVSRTWICNYIPQLGMLCYHYMYLRYIYLPSKLLICSLITYSPFYSITCRMSYSLVIQYVVWLYRQCSHLSSTLLLYVRRLLYKKCFLADFYKMLISSFVDLICGTLTALISDGSCKTGTWLTTFRKFLSRPDTTLGLPSATDHN